MTNSRTAPHSFASARPRPALALDIRAKMSTGNYAALEVVLDGIRAENAGATEVADLEAIRGYVSELPGGDFRLSTRQYVGICGAGSRDKARFCHRREFRLCDVFHPRPREYPPPPPAAFFAVWLLITSCAPASRVAIKNIRCRYNQCIATTSCRA